MLKDILQKMTSGEIYDPADKELLEFQLSRVQMVNSYNNTPNGLEHINRRERMLKEMLITNMFQFFVDKKSTLHFTFSEV